MTTAQSAETQGLEVFKTGERVRHCKIVGTLGPASSSEEVLSELINAGLNIARLNFSHGDHQTHAGNIEKIRRLAAEQGRHITILQDLQGPKIRCGKLIGDKISLARGEEYYLEYGSEQVEPNTIPIDYQELVQDVSIGHRVMMDDGLLILEIIDIENERVKVKVEEGGLLKNRKGVNFPDSILSLPALTEKDRRDLLFGVAQQVDVIALSFVQHPKDIIQCKKMIEALGSDIPVVAKIEKLSAVELIDEIAQVTDGLMVARGDLGVEGNVERVPVFQRQIIRAGARHAKPVIIATQMLESMIENPRASLAEIADVANGVLEGADCVMLSGEVAAGKYPVECVRTMSDIIHQVEQWDRKKTVRYTDTVYNDDQENWKEHEAIARSACEAADSLGARAIICLSLTGSIARLISRWRPRTPIITISPRGDVIRRLGFTWGVYGMQNPLFYDTDVLLQDLPKVLKDYGVVSKGDTIVITAGIPINTMCPTNMVKINKIN